MPRAVTPLSSYFKTLKSTDCDICFIDSTSIKVCHNLRIPRHKTFAGVAKRGRGTMGWYFGGVTRLCKARPNRKKGTFFPLLEERFRVEEPAHAWQDELPLFLDPLIEEDTLLLSFNDDGSPCPEIDLEADDIDRVEFTIEKYFLDETTLNTRRKVVWDTARSLYNEYLNRAKNRRSVAARQDAKAKLNELKSLMLPNKEFSSVAKASLLKLGENMARKIASS